MKTNKETMAVYGQVLTLLRANSDIFNGDINITSGLEARIKAMTLSNDFGIDVSPNTVSYGSDYVHLSDNSGIGLFGESHSRTISWSDDKTQPDNEWLYHIWFPTGAYIFGGNYPTTTFDEFFEELKSYNPKYTDTHNHALYYTKENAKAVHENFDTIFEKYKNISIEESRQTQIADLEAKIQYIKNQGK